MIDETILAHAVTLAAAFVANGDIRCGGNTGTKETCFAQISDILPTLYFAVAGAQRRITTELAEKA